MQAFAKVVAALPTPLGEPFPTILKEELVTFRNQDAGTADLIDLATFLARLYGPTSPGLHAATDALVASIEAARIASHSLDQAANPPFRGIGAFCPATDGDFQQYRSIYKELKFERDTGWLAKLSTVPKFAKL